MIGLEAIGSPHQSGSLRRDEIPVVRAQESAIEQQVESSERSRKSPQIERVDLPTRALHARLNYDQDADEVVVEILNPQTGDVLRQFPAEELPDNIRALVSDPQPLVEIFA